MYKTNTAGVISRNYYRYSKGNYSVLVLDADGATQEGDEAAAACGYTSESAFSAMFSTHSFAYCTQ